MLRSTKPASGEGRSTPEGGGLGGAVPYLREGAQLVTPRRPGVALPEGARVIPDTYSIVSVHQIGFVLVLGWAF